MSWLDDVLRVVQVLEPIIIPLISASDRDVKHDIKPIS